MKKERGTGAPAQMIGAAALVLIDWLTKRWAVHALGAGETMTLLDGIVGLRYVENTGAAFSALSGSTALLSGISLIICAGVAAYIVRHPEAGRLTKAAMTLILAGGAGNLIDRMLRGYVVDFIELLFMRFAIFNVADICVTVGAVLLFIALLCGGEVSGRMER